MSTPIVDVATWEATVTNPTDGEPANEAEFKEGLQRLANRTAYLKGIVDSFGMVRAYARAAGTGSETTVAQTIVGGILTAITGATVTMPASPGDILLVFFTARMTRDVAGNIQAQIVRSASGVSLDKMPGSNTNLTVADDPGAPGAHVTLIGHEIATVAVPHTYSFTAKASCDTSGTLEVRQNWALLAFAIKPPT